jgi:hypothetical protein
VALRLDSAASPYREVPRGKSTCDLFVFLRTVGNNKQLPSSCKYTEHKQSKWLPMMPLTELREYRAAERL